MATPRPRREPPPYRPVTVSHVEDRTPHLRRLTLTGDPIGGLEPTLPAASVRLLLPDQESGELTLPAWNGNEFLLPDGTRPLLRTLTPLRIDPGAREMDVAVVLHDASPLTTWAQHARAGTVAAVSGTGRGYRVDPEAGRFLLVGDEAALPAITTLLPELPGTAEVVAIIEVRDQAAAIDLAGPAGLSVRWCELPGDAPPGTAMVEALRAAHIGDDTTVWAAGEAAAVQQIRRHLSEEIGVPRERATVRGYWKAGRAEGG